MKTICFNFKYWKRKLQNGKFLLCFCIFFFFIFYYREHFLWFTYGNVGTATNEASKIELNHALRKIHFLTSMLRRWKVPEAQFLDKKLPKIYVITATYSRPVQKAELTRLKNIFLHVAALHWIIIEDTSNPTNLVTKFLPSSGISYTHLVEETPPEWKLQQNDPRWYKPRGVLQRNKGISWLRENLNPSLDGVVYFADDDNTYSMDLFEEMRNTKKVSVWPVGLVGGVMVERPIVNSEGHVDGFIVGWRPDRAFPIDMAGFAVNLELILKSNALFSQYSKRGFIESDFLEKIVSRHELEPKASDCTKVLVWHTQTKDPKLDDENRLRLEGRSTNLGIEV